MERQTPEQLLAQYFGRNFASTQTFSQFAPDESYQARRGFTLYRIHRIDAIWSISSENLDEATNQISGTNLAALLYQIWLQELKSGDLVQLQRPVGPDKLRPTRKGYRFDCAEIGVADETHWKIWLSGNSLLIDKNSGQIVPWGNASSTDERIVPNCFGDSSIKDPAHFADSPFFAEA